jgi:hypothetical protein
VRAAASNKYHIISFIFGCMNTIGGRSTLSVGLKSASSVLGEIHGKFIKLMLVEFVVINLFIMICNGSGTL